MQILNSRGAKDSEYIPLNIESAEIAQFLATIDQKMRVKLNVCIFSYIPLLL